MAEEQQHSPQEQKAGQQAAPPPHQPESQESGKAMAERPRGGRMRPAGFRDEIDRLFDEIVAPMVLSPVRAGLARAGWGQPTTSSLGLMPRADFVEKENSYEIALDVPGMTEQDIDVKVSDHTLTISGSISEEKEEEEKGEYYLSERRFGSFSRVFTLPQDINTDQVAADLKQGVLFLTLPKSEQAKSRGRKVEVKRKD